jgi:hypothetical protein
MKETRKIIKRTLMSSIFVIQSRTYDPKTNIFGETTLKFVTLAPGPDQVHVVERAAPSQRQGLGHGPRHLLHLPALRKLQRLGRAERRAGHLFILVLADVVAAMRHLQAQLMERVPASCFIDG